MSCISCVCTRGLPFSHVKTICNLHVIVSSLLYFFPMGWYGKYRWSVKYSTGSLVFISLPSVAWLVFVLGVTFFTCENHLQLGRISFFATLFIYHELVRDIPEVHKIQQWFFNFNISLPWVAWVLFVLGGHGFHMWKPFATCTNFFFATSFFSWIGTNGQYRRSVKYSNGSSILIIPFHELHELSLY